jgi:hypothetical protein
MNVMNGFIIGTTKVVGFNPPTVLCILVTVGPIFLASCKDFFHPFKGSNKMIGFNWLGPAGITLTCHCCLLLVFGEVRGIVRIFSTNSKATLERILYMCALDLKGLVVATVPMWN